MNCIHPNVRKLKQSRELFGRENLALGSFVGEFVGERFPAMGKPSEHRLGIGNLSLFGKPRSLTRHLPVKARTLG